MNSGSGVLPQSDYLSCLVRCETVMCLWLCVLVRYLWYGKVFGLNLTSYLKVGIGGWCREVITIILSLVNTKGCRHKMLKHSVFSAHYAYPKSHRGRG